MYKEHVSTKTVDAQFIYSLCISIHKRSSSGEDISKYWVGSKERQDDFYFWNKFASLDCASQESGEKALISQF